jgi:hypothetical protein
MSLVALTLNVALGFLLVCAMMLGLRLDRRLRALRESHLGFAKAVSELDQASLRTQAGLNELKATAEGVRADLAEQLDNARLLSERLVKLTAEADVQAQALAKARAAAPSLASLAAARPSLLGKAAAGQAPPAAAPARSRPPLDDDLFESAGHPGAGLSALAGGRR